MSIASELNNYRSGLEDAYDAVSDMSGTIPTDRNMVNLDDAIRTIPISSPNDGVLTITQNGTTIQTFSANQATNVTAALTDTTYSNFTGATSSTAGAAGLVPAPAAGDEGKALHGDGTWKDTTAKLVEMYYGESNAWAKFIAAYNDRSIVYCRASSNANPGSGAKTRKAFMAYVNNEDNPTSVEFQYVRSVSSKTDSQQCDQVFVYTLTNASGGTWSVASRNMSPKINVSGPITKTFSTGANATVTIGADAMTGATSGAAGAAGVVPAPAAGDEEKVLTGAGTWSAVAKPPLFGYVANSFLMGGAGPGNAIFSDSSMTSQNVLTANDIKNALAQGRSVFLMGMENGSISTVCQVLCFTYNNPNGYGAISWTFSASSCLAEALESQSTWTVY